jgi:hypothetical protein
LNQRQPRERQSPDWLFLVLEIPAFMIKTDDSQMLRWPIRRLAFPGRAAMLPTSEFRINSQWIIGACRWFTSRKQFSAVFFRKGVLDNKGYLSYTLKYQFDA